MIKIKLNSDFIDYYDHFMDYTGEIIFERKMKSGPNRIEMYKTLNMIGLKTPKFGMVAELYKDLGSGRGGVAELKKSGYGKVIELVVHTDINAHAGDGKVKLSLDEAREKYPGHFAVQFIPTAKTFASRTERVLVAGDRSWWLEYTSKDDWRSNSGEVSISMLDTRFREYMNGGFNELQLPLYAIDFVAIGNERLAIDLNISPGIKGTGIEYLMPAEQMAKIIKNKICDLKGINRF